MFLKSEFENITDDLFQRIKGDHNLQTGLKRFVGSYKSFLCGPAPYTTLATAFHHFGRNYSKQSTTLFVENYHFNPIDTLWSLWRFGKHIPVQSTALKRRRRFMPKGNRKSTSGRPPILKKGAQTFKEKYKPIKRKHNLSLNITKQTQNAGKW